MSRDLLGWVQQKLMLVAWADLRNPSIAARSGWLELRSLSRRSLGSFSSVFGMPSKCAYPACSVGICLWGTVVSASMFITILLAPGSDTIT